jgi:hypothetical protein
MTRLGIITFLIGLILADPVFCRSIEATEPCTEMSGIGHDHEPTPLDSCQDEAHNCACQGVTITSHARDDVAAPPATAIFWASLLGSDPFGVSLPFSSTIPIPGNADGPPVGRSTRIALCSYLI